MHISVAPVPVGVATAPPRASADAPSAAAAFPSHLLASATALRLTLLALRSMRAAAQCGGAARRRRRRRPGAAPRDPLYLLPLLVDHRSISAGYFCCYDAARLLSVLMVVLDSYTGPSVT